MTVKENYQPTEQSTNTINSSNKYQGVSKRSASRKTAIVVGIFYLAATAAGILSVYFMPDLAAPDYLMNLSANQNQIIIAALFEFTMAVLIAGIAIVLYPILVRQDETLALGYLVARIVESVIFIAAVISLLTLLTLSLEILKAGVPDTSHFQTIGALLLAVREWGGAVFATFVFSVSALLLNYIFYRSRLVPRWLSGWGLIGAILYLASSFLPLAGYGSSTTIYGLMQVVLGLQEMVLAVWLIVKGFSSRTIASESTIAER